MGFLDITCAVIIILYQYSVIPFHIVLAGAAFLILKAILFFGDFFSIIDGIIGIVMLLMFFIRIETVSFIALGYLVLKGLWSMF